jgi:Carboxypeptidase regulatory-like domain
MSMKKLAGGVALSVLTMAMASAVYAQETSSAISGQVTGADGKPAAGATVSITHVPTGTTATTVTSPNGYYIARGLRVGGPYTVKVTSGGASETTTVQSVGIGNPVPVDVSFAATEVAEVVVTAATANRENNGGPTTRFGLSDIQELPSLKRDLKDVARLNPMVTLDPSNFDAMVVAGTNSRYNSLTVDGVKQNDDFGLNGNGYPTQRGPISTDAVQAMAVNLAPFSVLFH